MQKIILLGAGGQLGREWQHQLKNENQIKLIACTPSQLDITDFEKVSTVIESERPDIIINCAAYTKVDLAEKELEKATLINATAVKNIAALCKKNRIKLIHYSTDYVFAGKKEDQKKFPQGYPEDHPADPVNRYGQSKWLGEQAVRESGCEHLIIRLSWLCGTYGNNFVTTMLKLAKKNERLTVVDDQLASPTFTHEVVPKTWQLIQLQKSGTYHITSLGIISWADFARAIFKISGYKIDVQPISTLQLKRYAKRPSFSKLSTAKIEELPEISILNWKEGLKKMMADGMKRYRV